MKPVMKKIRVLVVDDSALVRQMLTVLLNADAEIEVIGTAQDPYVARRKIKQLNPDVLTLDVEMPRMDGVTFLNNLMRLRPMPVIMISSLTERGVDVTLRALELGAVDFVLKPKTDIGHTLGDYAAEIIAKVKVAAQARVCPLEAESIHHRAAEANSTVEPVTYTRRRARPFGSTDKLIAIGASTGGTEAIREIIRQLPPDNPPVVIAQHIPETFSRSFALRMDSISPMTVLEAEEGQPILPGHAFVAPGNRHLTVERNGAGYIARVSDGPLVNRHRPSVDVLFRSVARNAGQSAIGVILTGMGDDGARGLKEMHDAGAVTFAQDEASSVVWGMPGEAVRHGAVDSVLSLSKIPAALLQQLHKA
jgi:two-component system, chemotaxis family, protein-glutamate methylesterase/glutaminase